MHEVIYTRTRNYQEKRKCLIPIYVIINYLNLKVMRTELLKKIVEIMKTIKLCQFEPKQEEVIEKVLKKKEFNMKIL